MPVEFSGSESKQENHPNETPNSNFEFEILRFSEVRREILKRMLAVVDEAQKEVEPDGAIFFLDKGARPLAWFFKEIWQRKNPNKPLPKIRFLNIGSDEFGSTLSKEEKAEKIKRLFGSQFDGRTVMVVDDIENSGRTKSQVDNIFRQIFPSTKLIFRPLFKIGQDNNFLRHLNLRLPWGGLNFDFGVATEGVIEIGNEVLTHRADAEHFSKKQEAVWEIFSRKMSESNPEKDWWEKLTDSLKKLNKFQFSSIGLRGEKRYAIHDCLRELIAATPPEIRRPIKLRRRGEVLTDSGVAHQTKDQTELSVEKKIDIFLKIYNLIYLLETSRDEQSFETEKSIDEFLKEFPRTFKEIESYLMKMSSLFDSKEKIARSQKLNRQLRREIERTVKQHFDHLPQTNV